MTGPSQIRRSSPLSSVALFVGLLSVGPAFAEDGPADYSALDNLSLFLGSTHEAVQRFGDLGETLANVRKGDFAGVGTGSTRRGLARGWNEWFGSLRGASAATKQSLPVTIAPHAFLASEVTTSVIAPLTEWDVRGATAGVVNVAVSTTAVGGGVALFGAAGAGVGATLGSFVPVIGTAAGGIVGGAIGTVAGGFIAASGYEIYVKQLVSDAVEGGIASVLDVAPLTQAMRAREERLRLQAALDLKPEWEKLHMLSEDFDMSSVELVSPPTIFYQPGAPGADDVPPTPPEPVTLAGLSGIAMKIWDAENAQYPVSSTCTISGSTFRCRGNSVFENWVTKTTFDGQIAGNTVTGLLKYTTQINAQDCMQTWAGQVREHYEFNQDGTLRAESEPHNFRLTFSSCDGAVSTASASGGVYPGSWSASR
jgi:hypothetical protein